MEERNTAPAAVFTGPISIYQDIELSLTENHVPPVVHVKQFDHRSRKVRCMLYNGFAEYTIPEDAVLSYSGTRPDGRLFHYTSEALRNDKVAVVGNRLVITVTDFMTQVSGRFPVDLVLIDTDGDVLGSFSFTLYVQRAAMDNRNLLVATYATLAEAFAGGIVEIFTTADGYFGVRSDDGVDFGADSDSDLIDRVEEKLVTAEINDGGYLYFETDDPLGLEFGMDGEGRLLVNYGEDR